MGLKFSNFGKALVSSAPSGTSGLSFSVAAGTGLLFPALAAGDYFYGIFKDASGNREIVKIEARSTDSMTIATGGRGLDGTTARTWAAGDYFVAGITHIALDESLGNANLQAIGALTSAADQLAYFTGSGTAALVGLSAFIRTLLDDADAATARGTLGLGSISTQSASAVAITGGAVTGITDLAIADGGTGASDAATARATLGVSYGPAFSAYASLSQSISSGVATKVTLGTEDFDTAGNFASSRFTPTVAGYYQVSGIIRANGTNLTSCTASIYKNGSQAMQTAGISIAATTGAQTMSVNGLVYLNGTTDYIELYGSVTATSPEYNYQSTTSTSRLSAFLARYP